MIMYFSILFHLTKFVTLTNCVGPHFIRQTHPCVCQTLMMRRRFDLSTQQQLQYQKPKVEKLEL